MPRIFDVHVHFPTGQGGVGGTQADMTPQQRLDYMAHKLREAGVVKACLLAGRRGPNFGISQEEALKALQPHKDLFIPVAVVDPGAIDAARIKELHNMGYRGFKIIGTELEYDDPRYFPLYEKAEEYNMPILFHCGVVGGGLDYQRTHYRNDPEAAKQFKTMLERMANPPATPQPGFPGRRNVGAIRMRPFNLDVVANNFPSLRIIGAHLGGTGNYDEAASVARWRHFVSFDLSGGEVIERHAMERGLIGREIGIEKLVWGSDCGADEVLTHVRRFEVMFAHLNLKPDQMERLWYRNAAEIYGVEKPEMASTH